MKASKKLVFVLLIALLTFGSAGQLFAAPIVKTSTLADGRVQIILEFDDLKEAEWAKEYIAKMQAKKVFTGYEDGTFRPNKPVTRAEAVVTAVRLLGLEDEAKAKDKNIKLNFKDAGMIDKQFSWAKGYVLVALEQGLFDASEDKLQPEKPATRLWVSTLLVKALGLQKEALQLMNEKPNFTDAKQIPAGAAGYVNVAVEKDLVKGYVDGSFQPNKPVTRAEMAAFLDRTNDGLLDQVDVTHVSGTVTEVVYKPATESMDEVIQLTLLSDDKQLQTYEMATDLLVGHKGSYIKGEQLKVADYVIVVVKEGKVVEAKILDSNELTQAEITEFKLEVELGKKAEIELSFKNKGKVEAKVEIESATQKAKLKGEEAANYITKLISDSKISVDMGKKDMVEAILAALDVKAELVQELELKVKFSNGKVVKVEIED